MLDVLLVSPELRYPDETVSGRSAEVREDEVVVNVGLLSVASYLEHQGLTIALLDLVGDPDHMSNLLDAVSGLKPRAIGFSCVSCYGYPVIADYCHVIRLLAPGTYLFGGGQHLSAIPVTALREIPELDCVVKGEGEHAAHAVLGHVLRGVQPCQVPSTVCRVDGAIVDNRAVSAPPVDLDQLPFLNYGLLPKFRRYCPEVEFSRGCPWSCHFCTDPYMFSNRVRYKSVPRFVAELQHIVETYGVTPEELRVFFTCSTFGIRRDRIEQLIAELRRIDLRVSWRTETRVDSPTVDYVDDLASVGMTVLDLGVESGSARMIERMNKTGGCAVDYLNKARRFIERVGASPTHLKINVVFHAGETSDTLAETFEFLLAQRTSIDSVSAGPVMMYPGTELAQHFGDYARRFGTSYIEGEFWDRVHAYKVNPSLEFGFEQLNHVAAVMSKMLTDERGYFAVKAHGQLPLGTTFSQWRETARHYSSAADLPFRIDIERWRTTADDQTNPFQHLSESRPPTSTADRLAWTPLLRSRREAAPARSGL